MFELVYIIFHYTLKFGVFIWVGHLTNLCNEYLMLTRLRVFLEDLLIHSVAFPFRVLILYSNFTQSRFVFADKIYFLELNICSK